MEVEDSGDCPQFYSYGEWILGITRRCGPCVRRPLSLPRPLLSLHHHSSQYPVDSRLVTRTLDLNQSTTSVSTRSEILRLRGRFQRASVLPSSSAKNSRSSSNDACSSISFRGRGRGFDFLVLGVTTQSYAPYRHDVTLLQEHCDRRALVSYRSALLGGRHEENLSHLDRRTARFGSLARPRQRLVHVSAFQYP